MKKNIILSILFFIVGFLTHAIFFPDILANGIADVKQVALPNAEPTNANTGANDPLITKITFDGKRFSRNNVTVGFTRYIQIMNTDKEELMELISSTKELTTSRGYAESEAVQMQFNQKGQFVVADRNNPEERLVITVK